MESLTKHFRSITRAAFARHGFAQADVVSNWTEIVGEDLGAISAPERIRWPRGAGDEARKSGGTLVMRAAPGRALDLQYEAPRIIGPYQQLFRLWRGGGDQGGAVRRADAERPRPRSAPATKTT